MWGIIGIVRVMRSDLPGEVLNRGRMGLGVAPGVWSRGPKAAARPVEEHRRLEEWAHRWLDR